MFKKISLAALAAVSMVATAQNPDNDMNVSPGSPLSYDHALRIVNRQMREDLRPADAWQIQNVIDYGPSNITDALVQSLARSDLEARAMAPDYVMYFPNQTAVSTTSVTSGSGGTTVTTTTTTTSLGDWEANARPLRMLMSSHRSREMHLDDARDIILSNIPNYSQRTAFADWWDGWDAVSASTNEKIAITHAVKDDAQFADEVAYAPLPAPIDWIIQ
jgi:hypothetical protein